MILRNTGQVSSDDRPCRHWYEEARFAHPTSERRLIETHISCVILTGEFAYKIKKPVDFGFVDYTTLERRKRFCHREVELNQRFASQLYLGVVAIYADESGGIRIGDQYIDPAEETTDADQVVEYAVKMRQFSQQAIIANRMTHQELTAESVEQFGRSLAQSHATLEAAIPTQKYSHPEQICHDAMENFEVMLDALAGDSRFVKLERLELWSRSQVEKLTEKFKQRLNQGKVKRCHGDLHLKNIIQLNGQLLAFDGIEFNEQFQFIDVLSEIAFPVMDFFARGRSDLGWRLLNAYLEATLDYEDLDVLRFYLVYRAMVRAKVAWLNPDNHTESRRAQYATAQNPSDPRAGPWDKFIAVAKYFAFVMQPKLSITHGFSGSGKSTIAMQVIDQEGGIRIRSDALRVHLAEQFHVTDKYSPAMIEWVYRFLAELADNGLAAGFPIIADGTFLKREQRRLFIDLVDTTAIEFEIIDCHAPFEELCTRLENRTDDPSEADVGVLRQQMAYHDPLEQVEKQWVRNPRDFENHRFRNQD